MKAPFFIYKVILRRLQIFVFSIIANRAHNSEYEENYVSNMKIVPLVSFLTARYAISELSFKSKGYEFIF